MSRLLFICAWFLVCFGVFATTTATVGVLNRKQIVAIPSTTNTQVASSLYPNPGTRGVSSVVEAGDARKEIVAQFLARYNSPLQPYDHFANYIVDAADRYGLDYRLIPAIMMQESNLCKRIIPGSHNCLGFGIHERGTLTFDTYEESIERATRELRQNYLDEGRTTPEQIMKKYTPGSDGSWANSVNQWIAEMEYNSRQMGLQLDQDADLTQYIRGKISNSAP